MSDRPAKRDVDEDWDESYARFADYERTGDYLDAGVTLEAFQRMVVESVRAKPKGSAAASG